MSKPKLPRESKSQAIGHLATRAFTQKHPTNWRAKDLSGDDDAGLDFRVQVVAEDEYNYDFFAQVKGSTKNALSSDGSFYSVPLKVSTITFLKQTGNRVMLVFADLSKTKDPTVCPVCFAWIHDELASKLPLGVHLGMSLAEIK